MVYRCCYMLLFLSVGKIFFKFLCISIVYIKYTCIFVPVNHQNKNKMLVSEARTKKNLQNAEADYQAKKLQERNNQAIKWYESKIEEEKEAIKDCLNQNFFSMAKSKIERIEEMKNKINSLR